MIYQFLANLFLALHLGFVIFAVFGGLLLFRWKWIWKLHIPAVVWGFLVQYYVWICPLTSFENYFRSLAGETGYSGGFIEYYLTAILYPSITELIHLILAFTLIAFNLLIYASVIWNSRKLN